MDTIDKVKISCTVLLFFQMVLTYSVFEISRKQSELAKLVNYREQISNKSKRGKEFSDEAGHYNKIGNHSPNKHSGSQENHRGSH